MGLGRQAMMFAIAVLALIQLTHAQNSIQDILAAHNAARAAVGVGPVYWDNTVAAYAENYAQQRIHDCQLIHSNGPYGENIYWGYGEGFSAATDAINYWVSEKQYYDYSSNSCAFGQECLHYTQMVWRSSTQIGCARVACDNGAFFTTCNYNPPGNIYGQWPY